MSVYRDATFTRKQRDWLEIAESVLAKLDEPKAIVQNCRVTLRDVVSSWDANEATEIETGLEEVRP